MISILIPVFGEDVTHQVQVLVDEITLLNFPVEILVIDDASDQAILPRVNSDSLRFVSLSKNLGRSKIRNYLAQEAMYDKLIFIDADCVPNSAHFIANYARAFQADTVLVGGQKFQPNRPKGNKNLLRWQYGSQVEARKVGKRKELPYASFMANNFCISKKLILAIGFDQNHTGYGHEDTLFGMKLRHKQIPVMHISNEVLHCGLETNLEFLNKTDEGISNLVELYKSAALDHHVRLIATYQKLNRVGLVALLVLVQPIVSPILRRWLQNTGGTVSGFGLYKLLGFIKKMKG